MSDRHYRIEEFHARCREIETIKKHIHHLMGVAVLAFLGAGLLERPQNPNELSLIAPFLVICVGLYYLSLHIQMMRCGRYIRLYIEPQLAIGLGWEEWLEIRDRPSTDPRLPDRCQSAAFKIILIVYYIAASYFAAKYCLHHVSADCAAIATGAYLGIGYRFLRYVNKCFVTSTSEGSAGSFGRPHHRHPLSGADTQPRKRPDQRRSDDFRHDHGF